MTDQISPQKMLYHYFIIHIHTQNTCKKKLKEYQINYHLNPFTPCRSTPTPLSPTQPHSGRTQVSLSSSGALCSSNSSSRAAPAPTCETTRALARTLTLAQVMLHTYTNYCDRWHICLNITLILIEKQIIW